jgi:hypothetical protein
MAYGTVKVDNITFDNGGSDQNVTVSGIYNSLTSGVLVTGTISGAVIIGSTSVSGTTVTGTTIQGTTGTFVSLTGTTTSGVTAQFTTGTFTSLTGTTTTGTTANFVTGNFSTRVSGVTVLGTTGTFTSLTGTTISGQTYIASGGVTFVSGSGDVRPYGLYSFPATTSTSGFQLITYGNGTTAWENKVRSISAGATTGTLTPNSNTTDIFVASGLTGDVTFAVPTGSPTNGQKLLIRIKDNGTARALTWTTSAGGYRVIGISLPTTTVINKTTYVGCVYNSADSFWDAVATVTEA